MPNILHRIHRAAYARRSSALRATASRALPLFVPFALACGTEGFESPPSPAPDALYWDLALNHKAVTLALDAPYDTLTVAAVPRNPAGDTIPGLPVPTYSSTDFTKVVVTPDGVLRAVNVTAEPVLVTATLTAGNIKHSDSVFVRVVDIAEPPVLTTFSVQPVAPDSAKAATGLPYRRYLPVYAADDHGQPMSDLMVAFRTSNRSIADIIQLTGMIMPGSVGKVTFYAGTTAFGVTKADSVVYRIGAPIIQILSVWEYTETYPGLELPTFTVGVGAIVMFGMRAEDSTGFSIEFDDADLSNVGPALNFSELARSGLPSVYCAISLVDCAGSGNLIVGSPTSFRAAGRIFTAPGTYDYRCVACDRIGRFIVVDEREP